MHSAQFLCVCCLFATAAAAECGGDPSCTAEQDASSLLQSANKVTKVVEPHTMPQQKEDDEPEDACVDIETQAACTVTGSNGQELCTWNRRRSVSSPFEKCSAKECEEFSSSSTCPPRCNWCSACGNSGGKCIADVISFGGKEHADGVAMGYQNLRPENVKSLRCKSDCEDPDNFEDCDDPNYCFKGVGTNIGYLKVNVPAGLGYSQYEAQLWTECSKGLGQWEVRLEHAHISNGEFSVYVNGLKQTAQTSSEWQRTIYRIPLLSITNFAEMLAEHGLSNGNTESRLRAVFKLTDDSLAATARVRILVKDPKPFVDQCMGQKMCLSELDGDGSVAGKRIRDSNRIQYDCLTGNIPPFVGFAVKLKCTQWIACLGGEDELDGLIAILGAAVAGGALLQEGSYDELQSTAVAKGDDDDNCVHPASDDPESWDCQCGAALQAGPCPNLETTCVRKEMCKTSWICPAWKDVKCDPFGHPRSMLVERSYRDNMSQSSLDDTVTTKSAC